MEKDKKRKLVAIESKFMDFFGVDYWTLHDKTRNHEGVRARGLFYCIAYRQFEGMTWQALAKYFGRKTHASAMNAAKKCIWYDRKEIEKFEAEYPPEKIEALEKTYSFAFK